jgi:hypothetical protein
VGLLALGYPKVALAFFPSLLLGMSMAMDVWDVINRRCKEAKANTLNKASRWESELSTKNVVIAQVRTR